MNRTCHVESVTSARYRWATSLTSFFCLLQIQAISCGGAGSVAEVAGTCFIPETFIPAAPESFSEINVIIPVVAAVIIIIAIGIFIYKRRFVQYIFEKLVQQPA